MERLKLTTCIMLILLSSSGRGQNAEIIKYNNEITVDLGVGLAVIAWMSFLAPLHTYLTIVLGTTAIFVLTKFHDLKSSAK